jgi:hypothetical protein
VKNLLDGRESLLPDLDSIKALRDIWANAVQAILVMTATCYRRRE